MLKVPNILIYEWRAWTGFLISSLVEEQCRLCASPEDDISHLEPALRPGIEAVLFQINLSESANFPLGRAKLITALENKGIKVLNKNIDDITKRNLHVLLSKAGISTAKASKAGDPEEILFVKSNLNWGGEVEHTLCPSLRDHYGPASSGSRITQHDQYYTIRRKDVTKDIWADRSLFIERYIDNTEDAFYRIYGCGASIVVVKAHARGLIKKINNHPLDINYFFERQKIIEEKTQLPESLQNVLRKFLTDFEIDYFCLDIVHDTQEYFIIDLNLTPYLGPGGANPEASAFLIRGLRRHLRKPKS
ncbi:MAG: hypothetical protein AAF441_22725 [Pseudomonadota bacterium]